MPYSWILFDLDNTLYDFDKSSRFALEQTFSEYKIEFNLKNEQLYYQINKDCWTAFENGEMDFETLRSIRFERFAKAIGHSLNPEKMADLYLHLLSETDFKIDGAVTLLDYLKPKYKLAVVTNGLKEVKRPQLSKPEIAHYFQAVIISEEVGIAKPEAGFFEHTFNQIGNPEKSEVIIIGDNLNSDIKGGNNFGIDTCWFNPLGHKNNSSIKPTYEIRQLSDLPIILL